MSEGKKLFLLDAFALIYRGYFAFAKNPRINSKGLDTSAIYGFTNSFVEVIKNQKPSHLAVVFDTPKPTQNQPKLNKIVGSQVQGPTISCVKSNT